MRASVAMGSDPLDKGAKATEPKGAARGAREAWWKAVWVATEHGMTLERGAAEQGNQGKTGRSVQAWRCATSGLAPADSC